MFLISIYKNEAYWSSLGTILGVKLVSQIHQRLREDEVMILTTIDIRLGLSKNLIGKTSMFIVGSSTKQFF